MSAVRISNNARAEGRSVALSSRGLRLAPAGLACGHYLAAGMVFSIRLVSAQQALQNSLMDIRVEEARPVHGESLPYTFKSGDFRMTVTPSLEADWNDNVTLSKTNTLHDFILRPLLEFDGSYFVSQQNLLRFNVGVGYDQYLEHDEFSGMRLLSDSGIAFDAYVKDVRINLHYRFQYTQDPAEQASVANTGRYGGFDNTAGVFSTWNLRDLVFTLGYDHESFIASASEFDYLNRASELLFGRAGFSLHPRVTVGVEGTGSFTSYQQPVLNDNQSYSGGMFALWTPGSYFRIQAHGGYCGYLVDQTSQTITAVNQSAMYAALTASHQISEVVGYSVSAGHELRLGTSADLIEATYVRSSIDWQIMKNLAMSPFLSYEHGRQGQSGQTGALAEIYNWMGTGLSLSRPITRRLTLALKYRLTLRGSDVVDRGYTQNVVGLQLIYRPE
jgi:hypothetical protein